jgi:hypothetical protein
MKLPLFMIPPVAGFTKYIVVQLVLAPVLLLGGQLGTSHGFTPATWMGIGLATPGREGL